MGKRKHISWKTKCACVLGWWDGVPYTDLKQMTEDQFLSLYEFDHHILHESGHEDRDKFWNLKPLSHYDHKKKTREDMKIIAKGRRIRKKLAMFSLAVLKNEGEPYDEWGPLKRFEPGRRKIRSRGFDKTKRRKMSGKVVER